MASFVDFSEAVRWQFDKMAYHQLFVTDISKDDMWQLYLDSFPEGTNPIYRERREYDCSCCRSFIKAAGNVIAVIDGQRVSIWDNLEVDGHYKIVATSLSELVKSAPIRNIFLHDQKNLGVDYNREMTDDGKVITWNHFFYKLDSSFVSQDRGTRFSEVQSSVSVFKRGLEEITEESLNVVLDLIDQNSLYRGKEHRPAVAAFAKEFKDYYEASNTEDFPWVRGVAIGGLARFRNSVIGTLVVDISEGKTLDEAVSSFEAKVAPQNYKRTSALVTKGMIDQAKKKVEELGIRDSLSRRFANKDDITVNNILFVHRPTELKEPEDVFGEMAKEVKVKAQKFDKVEEVPVESFIKDILPKVNKIEVMVENQHANKLMTLVAPVTPQAKNIFKWDNNFSWSYNGNVTDSIKERVKKAGGNVDGVLRCSLSWFNYDDLDIHVREPKGGRHIYFSNNKNPSTTGELDVDMNAGGNNSRSPVENIVWTNKAKMLQGAYELWVHNFCKREDKDVGFNVEVEYKDGGIYRFAYDKKVRQDENVPVAKFNFSHTKGIEVIESLPLTQTSQELWGISTQHFHNVSMVMNSPNHWDGNETGNKHWFFIIEGCKNPESVRGFYNEFLDNNLTPHRKVFEIMSAKMEVPYTDDQLTGLGFSSTQRNSVVCKVSGSFTRVIKIIF